MKYGMKWKLTAAAFPLFCVTVGCRQEDEAKRVAIDQMRKVAGVMKQCPEERIGTLQTECHVYNNYAGPPTNLEWDVLPSKSVRSPFQGTIEFTLPYRLETVDPPNQLAKDHEKCVFESAISALKQSEKKDETAETPKWREARFRYEFDLGGDAPELVKTLLIAKDGANNFVPSPTTDSGHECWVVAAKSIGPTGTR